MIIDLKKEGLKEMFITEKVRSIQENEYGLWRVMFYSGKMYQYRKERLLYLTNPELIDIENRGLYINNIRISNIAELTQFSDQRYRFYRITYNTGYTECLDGKDVYITRTPINESGGSTWNYLLKLSEETGLLDDDGNNVLSKGYSLVDVKRDNVPLAQYLGSKSKLATDSTPPLVYFPFGCNASQKKAVEAALTNQVSIIQGPPGTGKTQTILNIISNLILSKKKVLVVSSNNSAVLNIAEKLQKVGLEFLVAQLGNGENKKAFISGQKSDYPDMNDWLLENPEFSKDEAMNSLNKVSNGFESQEKLAKLKSEYNSLITEMQYSEILDNGFSQEMEWLYNKPSKTLWQLLIACQLKEEQEKSSIFGFALSGLLFLEKIYSLS